MMTFSFSKSYRGYYLLPDYGPVISVNRPLRLSASGGDPHEGWCGEGELEAPLYPIISILNLVFFQVKLVLLFLLSSLLPLPTVGVQQRNSLGHHSLN